MDKVQRYTLPTEKILSDADLQEFAQGLAIITSSADMMRVLSTVFTERELKTLKNRWRMVKMLNQHIPYRTIAQKLRISTTSLTRASLSLQQEKEGWETLFRALQSSL